MSSKVMQAVELAATEPVVVGVKSLYRSLPTRNAYVVKRFFAGESITDLSAEFGVSEREMRRVICIFVADYLQKNPLMECYMMPPCHGCVSLHKRVRRLFFSDRRDAGMRGESIRKIISWSIAVRGKPPELVNA